MQALILQKWQEGSQDYSVLFLRVRRKQEQKKEPRWNKLIISSSTGGACSECYSVNTTLLKWHVIINAMLLFSGSDQQLSLHEAGLMHSKYLNHLAVMVLSLTMVGGISNSS